MQPLRFCNSVALLLVGLYLPSNLAFSPAPSFQTRLSALKAGDKKMMESLTASSIQLAIDDIINDDDLQKEWTKRGIELCRATEPNHWSDMMAGKDTVVDASAPWYFGLTMRDNTNNKLCCGFVTFYLAYSSWDGRFLYVDRLECDDDDSLEILLTRTLAKLTVQLHCARLTWRHKNTPSWYYQHPNSPETQEWLTLSMDRQAMAALGGEQVKVFDGALNRSLVQAAANDCLASMNQSKNYQFQLRLAATRTDADTIMRLVHGLAVFDNEPDAVNMTVDEFIRDAFDSDEPLFYCLLLDHTDEQGKVHTAGMAFVYFGHTLGEGRFLYLEDLFLEEAYRKKSGGSMAMQALARIGQACQCQRLFWQALEWNTPALSFYNKIGAKIHEGELTTRYDGDRLKQFVQEGV